MQATHVSTSVSQTAQDSELRTIRYFKLAVDTFFLRMENNLADEKDEKMFKDEDHIIEKAEQIEILYQQLFISDEKKSELRQYILKEADTFNSKFEEAYGKSYMDDYFDFIESADFDTFDFHKKLKAGTFFYPKAIKNVVVTDSDSESEDEKSMVSETQSEADSDDSDASSSDSESEEEDDDETMYDSEEEDEDISNLDLEEEYRFYKKRTSNLEAVIDDLRTQKDENIEQIRQLKEDFDKMKKSRDHFEWLNKKRQENEVFLINQQNKTQDETAVKINELEDKIKVLKDDLEEMEEGRDYFEKENEENEHNIKKLKKENEGLKNELEEVEHNHSVDANALFKEIGKNNKLKKQIRLLKLLIK
jgi:hypothetical protein